MYVVVAMLLPKFSAKTIVQWVKNFSGRGILNFFAILDFLAAGQLCSLIRPSFCCCLLLSVVFVVVILSQNGSHVVRKSSGICVFKLSKICKISHLLRSVCGWKTFQSCFLQFADWKHRLHRYKNALSKIISTHFVTAISGFSHA